MVQADVPACLGIVSDCRGKSAAQSAQPDLMEMFSSSAWRPFFYVSEEEREVVGHAGHCPSRLNYGAHALFWVAVKSDMRGRGRGGALVERCMADLRPSRTS